MLDICTLRYHQSVVPALEPLLQIHLDLFHSDHAKEIKIQLPSNVILAKCLLRSTDLH